MRSCDRFLSDRERSEIILLENVRAFDPQATGLVKPPVVVAQAERRQERFPRLRDAGRSDLRSEGRDGNIQVVLERFNDAVIKREGDRRRLLLLREDFTPNLPLDRWGGSLSLLRRNARSDCQECQ